MPDCIILAGSQTAGVASPRDDRNALVFRASHPAFATLDGSSFANRHAVQRAVDRIARLDGLISTAGLDYQKTMQDEASA